MYQLGKMSYCSAKQVILPIQPSQVCHKSIYPKYLQHPSQKKLPLYFFCAPLIFLSLSLAFNAIDSHTLDRQRPYFHAITASYPLLVNIRDISAICVTTGFMHHAKGWVTVCMTTSQIQTDLGTVQNAISLNFSQASS